MAKHRHKHHRKVNQNRFSGVKVVSQTEVPTSDIAGSTPKAAESEITHVVRDLRVTTYLTTALVLLLALGSYLNTRTDWTLHFGDLLYRLLHIG